MATKETEQAPRAVIHKRILESAETQPDASLVELSTEVAGASPDLVERVLDEYGDPALDQPTEPDSTEDDAMTEHPTLPTAAELTEKQLTSLRAVAKRPEATQAELAEALGVSRATVNKRLNAIDGFDWADREAFVAAVLDADAATPPSDTDAVDQPAPEAAAAVDGGQLRSPDAENAVEQLQERVARLERELDEPVGESGSALEDTPLLAKVMRAVMADDDIDRDEEVEVLEALR